MINNHIAHSHHCRTCDRMQATELYVARVMLAAYIVIWTAGMVLGFIAGWVCGH